jgi:hypothetical protein
MVMTGGMESGLKLTHCQMLLAYCDIGFTRVRMSITVFVTLLFEPVFCLDIFAAGSNISPRDGADWRFGLVCCLDTVCQS